MKRSHRARLTLYSVLVLIILVVAATYGAAHVAKHHPAKSKLAAKVEPQLPQKTPGEPQFSFTGTADWRQGPTDKVSMALFHNTDGCFTSVQHKPGKVDEAAELKKNQTSLENGGYTVVPGNTKTMTLQTSAGPQQYRLHQFRTAGPPASTKLMNGLQLGYVQLSGSYIKIEGHCDTSAQLPATIPALRAIKFNESDSL